MIKHKAKTHKTKQTMQSPYNNNINNAFNSNLIYPHSTPHPLFNINKYAIFIMFVLPHFAYLPMLFFQDSPWIVPFCGDLEHRLRCDDDDDTQ